MKTRPDAQDLLTIARETFARDILPALPDTLRYHGLMLANALAIAARDLAAGDAPLRAELEGLRRLYPGQVQAGAGSEAQVADYNRRLASDIRAGRFDGKERGMLIEHLRRITEDKLAISNPKALSRR